MSDEIRDFADAEIERRSERGRLLMTLMPPDLKTFSEFCDVFMDKFGIDMDFITCSEAWTAYKLAQSDGK